MTLYGLVVRDANRKVLSVILLLVTLIAVTISSAILFYPQGTPAAEDLPNAPPEPRFTWSPAFPLAGQEVVFDATPSNDSDGRIVRYTWNFGDGAIVATNDSAMMHSYSEGGQYAVGLTVTDNEGARNSTREDLTVGGHLPFRTIDQDWSSGWTTPGVFLIRNRTQWRDVWKAVYRRQTGLPPSLEIDFDRQTIMAAFQGPRSSGCYWLEVVEVEVTESGLSVSVVQHMPGSRIVCAAVITTAYHLVSVNGTWSRATFGLTNVFTSCGESECFVAGVVEFGAQRPTYRVGDTLRFSIRNGLPLNITLRGERPWTIYRDVDGEWKPVASEAPWGRNLTLAPFISVSWEWRAEGETGDGDLVPVGPGLYRIDLIIEYSSHRVLRAYFSLE